MKMNEGLLREWLRRLLHERKSVADPYFDLAATLEAASNGILQANVGQGRMKGRDPHSRLQVTDTGKEKLEGILGKIKEAGWNTQRDAWAKEINSLLSLPANITYVGAQSVGKFSKTFPALEFEYTPPSYPAKAGEPPPPPEPAQIIPVVITVAGARTASGAAYQDSAAGLITQKLAVLGFPGATTSTATKGSQVPDIIVSIPDKKPFNIEVKGPGGKFFDKTMKRGETYPPASEQGLIDKMASAMAKKNGFKASTLEEYIDDLQTSARRNRKEKSGAGYIGDRRLAPKANGEARASGGLPSKYFAMAPDQTIVDALKAHWKAGKDLYFAVSDGSTTHIWYTGDDKGDPQNILKANVFDANAISGDIKLSTYGSAGKERVRAALTAKFNLSSATILKPEEEIVPFAIMPEMVLRSLIRETLLTEELTKSDKKEIEKITRKQIKRDLIDKKEITKIARKEAETEIKKSLGASFLGTPGKINQAIQDIAREEMQTALKGKELEKAAADVTKRVLYAFYKMMYNRKNLIDDIKLS
jgi:hypothetical protein